MQTELFRAPEVLAQGDVDDLLERARFDWAPPPRLSVSEFADTSLTIPTGPYAGTRWRTDFAPYQRGVLDAFEEPGVEHVVLMSSAQVGKTSIALAMIAYHVAHDPCPIMVVEPTVDPMAKDFSTNRLDPLVEASPVLRDRISRRRQGGGKGSSMYQKNFRGGLLAISGANSAASLASRSIRLLLLDEIDRYPPELRGEGATIEVAMKRCQAYRGQRRIAMFSTPTMRDAPIDSWFRTGDQRRFHAPCTNCGSMHVYRWRNVRWEEADPNSARLHCPDCDHGMNDTERIAALDHGEWRPTQPRELPHVVSFHLWEAMSPFSTLSEIVGSFLKARRDLKAGDRSTLHTWQNTTLGEPVEHDAGEGVESTTLLTRREEYPAPVPGGASLITMGVDTQDDRLEALLIAWGPGEESWLIDRHELPGDTTQPEPWSMLDELLSREYLHETGQRISISATCIDSAGHRTTIVYDYCLRNSGRRVYATIGRDGERPIISSPTRKRLAQGRAKVPLYTVGVDAAKALLMSRLQVTEKGPGYVHVPQEHWADEELAAQLTSERLVTTYHKGVPRQRWKKTRPRNEMLDCAVLNVAALRLVNPDLALLHERLHDPDAEKPGKGPKKERKRFIDRKRSKGWMKR